MENTIPNLPTQPVVNPQVPPVNPTIPPASSMPKKKMSVGAIIGTILFFLIAGGAAAGFVYKDAIVKMVSKPTPTPAVALSPTPTPPPAAGPTADWKTYIDAKNGFEFKYPSDWTKEDRSTYGDKYQEVTFNAPKSTECLPPKVCGGGLNGITVSVLDNPKSLTLEEFIKQDLYDMFNLSHFVKDNSAPGFITDWMIDRNAPGTGNGQQVLISHGKLVVEFYCGSCNDLLTNQILSTFKFTDAKTVDTSTWKVHKIGTVLSFKAPSNYFIKSGGTSGKDVVIVADKEASITPSGNYLTIDANGLSGYELYSNYESVVKKIESQAKATDKIQKLTDRIILTSTYIENGESVHGLTEYIKAKDAAIFISFQSEDFSNPHMFDTIISTIKITP